MGLFEPLLFNCIFLAFPVIVYLLYVVYTKNTDTKEKNIFLELALLSSIFLTVKSYKDNVFIYQLLLINIPLIIAYLKKRNSLVIVISIIIVLIYYNYHINIYLLLFEYILYIVLYINIGKNNFYKYLSIFLFIKSFITSLEICVYINPTETFIYKICIMFLDVFILNSVTYFMIFLMQKAEETVDLNITLRELEKEKALRESLFKMTHEIKNPIAVCKGYIDMIKAKKTNKEVQEKYIHIIDDEISRTLLLMDDFLDYTKIKVNKELIDITMLIEDIIDNLSPILKVNSVKLKKDIPEEDIYIDADYNRLKQAFINIIKNAIEARKEKEKLTIDIKLRKSNNYIKIVINDNGTGMNKETLNKINDMFFTTKAKGTGLGIPLSQEIIKLHEGSLKYQTIQGKGTKAIIMLPAKKIL